MPRFIETQIPYIDKCLHFHLLDRLVSQVVPLLLFRRIRCLGLPICIQGLRLAVRLRARLREWCQLLWIELPDLRLI